MNYDPMELNIMKLPETANPTAQLLKVMLRRTVQGIIALGVSIALVGFFAGLIEFGLKAGT